MYELSAFLIIVVIVLIYRNTCNAEEFLTGVWLADSDEFCEYAEIKSMVLYIGEPSGLIWYERECYLIIMDGFCNQDLTMTYRAPWCVTSDIVHFTCDVEFSEEAIWGNRLRIEMNTLEGSLVIHDDDGTLLASLSKRHDL